jgi:hypothetical protein
MRLSAGDHACAFRQYDESFRPFISEFQAEAVRFGLEAPIPRTEEATRARNATRNAGFSRRAVQVRAAGSAVDAPQCSSCI